ncbi:ArgE/DapE family deacylase [Liquorilactobacillus hordei]|uniref:Probable succinyl-diaminopimelate desuccinylase n=2 Tax=Liquorilactobacillus hordei TaxID=468911 RepID=A0A0R1MMS0_9LACO|nr:ArgE/DapE family deacylase [Liquorilactobacillus hordei]KRL06442.1 acetylornithine deacetylase succinyl-diaminopimelate desuccinylase-like protein [Liquorilactobacillus hordei DSM 19519]QYH51286.1 ArgE/DapE family deacylase [Liquorilactobacillus hordei DSM 19519]
MDKKTKIEILKNILAIESVNDNETAVADYIASLFTNYQNVSIEKVAYASNRDNLVITIGNSGPILGYSGHMDVVAPGNLADWSTPPFEPTIIDSRIFGRGATDMKGGLSALVVALLELLEKKAELPGQIRLLATVGEETGEYGAAQLTKLGYADNLAGLLIAEPTDNMQRIVYTARGVIDYKVTSKGKSAHSARPQYGINAIDNLIEFYKLAKIRLATFTATDEVLGGVTHNITVINGGEQVNNIPSYAELLGNIRTIPQYPNKLFYAELEKIITELNKKTGFNLAITYSFPEEAIPGSPDSPVIQIAKEVHSKYWEQPAAITGSLGANDGAEFLQAKGSFNSIVIGPGSNTSHQSNEYMDIDSYLKAIDFYQDFALTFLSKQSAK